MKDTNTATIKLHYIKKDSLRTPVVNYSGYDESQNYSDEYTYLETDIQDARDINPQKEFSLDKEGFKLVNFKPNEIDFSNSVSVKQSYYKEVEELVKEQTGATNVFVFDHTVRQDLEDSNRKPAYHVHNDYTYETGQSRPLSTLGKDIMEKFRGKRMIQINVWRSIAGTVERDPLALMDAMTLDQKDLVRTKINFNDMKTGEKHFGEIFALKKNIKQKWYYFSKMNASEAILIKGFDSDPQFSCFAMHSAFALPEQSSNDKPRQSIETRTFAFFDD